MEFTLERRKHMGRKIDLKVKAEYSEYYKQHL